MNNTIKWIPALLLIGMTACNNSGNSSTATDTTAAAAKDTSMAMTSVAPLPAVPAGAKVYFKNLKDGQKVTSPVKIEFGADGIAVDTAGPVKDSSGHFHLLIDAGDSVATGVVVPKDSTHIHYGKAQMGATIPLTPGKHTLALQFADGIHRSYGARLAAVVTVDVQK
jgi:hypothetical protein